MNHFKWDSNQLVLLDQRKLPHEEIYFNCKTHTDVADAISKMIIRGAPAIGAAAAFGVVLGLQELAKKSNNATDPIKKDQIKNEMKQIEKTLKESRPTAVNLQWAVDRIINKLSKLELMSLEILVEEAEKEAVEIAKEDKQTNKAIGKNGQSLIDDNSTVLTHCNAGALATVDYGTALGVIRSAVEEGKNLSIIATETRPYLQGARLTAWELLKEKIPTTLITDNMVGYCMKKNMIDTVIVGADRIAKNGDVANKIGTYTLALLAHHHNIPFYVAAPISTFDLTLNNGSEIPIETRDDDEVTKINDLSIAPENVEVFNPSFDITPNKFVWGIITEKGVIKKPDKENIEKFFK
ncbi:S-methyl-5-thioribose-1-phosphate isomerase [Natranaerofaba carboxydovora]|uniref:S-methyl-5-thioribose-1-phosphate isomerase n=1 Tax=Natranaerofaba carboxydovora TaxID=2742683 RepID=UPI001F13FEF0|nr:S-methyl-5-thioribose-1-phosphate isomerase [Natranaerofaba carboxydovora]UMZ73579.1 Methylthioribose-1-phosphate isomerase [Natranaerofaba carboxydovora]